MLADDLFLARTSCFHQASLVSSVGSLTACQGYGVRRIAGCQHWLPTASIGLSRTGFDFTMHSFLSNVNSRSPSLFAVASPSVCLSVVCLSVTLVHPTRRLKFSAIFLGHYRCLGHPLTSIENFTEIPRGNPPPGELNTRGVVKYNDFGPVDGYLGNSARQEVGQY